MRTEVTTIDGNVVTFEQNLTRTRLLDPGMPDVGFGSGYVVMWLVSTSVLLLRRHEDPVQWVPVG